MKNFFPDLMLNVDVAIRVCGNSKGLVMFILGVLLLLFGFLFGVSVLVTLGFILIVVGVVLMVVPIGGRKRRYY